MCVFVGSQRGGYVYLHMCFRVEVKELQINVFSGRTVFGSKVEVVV